MTADLVQEIYDDIVSLTADAHGGRQLRQLCLSHERLRAELAGLEELRRQDLDVLQTLYDFQNGPPLEKYRVQWNEAMAKAKAALRL